MPVQTVEELKDRLQKYEENGPNKLYYALSRKCWEMGDLLNSVNLKNLSLDDSKDKTFDRLKVIWNDASSIALAVKELGKATGVTGDEAKDVSGNFIEEVAETRR